MDDLANYCFHLSCSQVMLDLRESRGNYDSMLILRGVVTSSKTSVEIQRVIWMSLDGVL